MGEPLILGDRLARQKDRLVARRRTIGVAVRTLRPRFAGLLARLIVRFARRFFRAGDLVVGERTAAASTAAATSAPSTTIFAIAGSWLRRTRCSRGFGLTLLLVEALRALEYGRRAGGRRGRGV